MRVGNISDGATSTLEQTITANGQTVVVDVNTSQVVISAAANYTGTLLSTSDAEEGQRITVRYDGANYVDIPNSTNVLNKHKLTMRLMAGQSIEYMFDGAKWREVNRVFNSVSIRAALSSDYVIEYKDSVIQYDDADAFNSDHYTIPVKYSLDCSTAGSGTFDTVIESLNPNTTISLIAGGAESIVVTNYDVAITFNVGTSTVGSIETLIGATTRQISVKIPGAGAGLGAGDGFGSTALTGGSEMLVTADNYDIVTVCAAARSISASGGTQGTMIIHNPFGGTEKSTGDFGFSSTARHAGSSSISLMITPGDTIQVKVPYSSVTDRILYTDHPGGDYPGSHFSCDSVL